MVQFVTHEECQTMRDLRAEGWTVKEISMEVDRTPGVVSKHSRGVCSHFEDDLPYHYQRKSNDELTAELRRVAQRVERVPNMPDWIEHAEFNCTAGTLVTRFGSWQDALAAADLPVVADAPPVIREAAYQNPSLTVSIEERYQTHTQQHAEGSHDG